MKKINNKGFTLIELLAVIIILGVLLIIAVPAISRYIEDSRRSTYVNSVKSIVSAISASVNNLEYPIPGKNEGLIIPFSEVELEKGVSNTKSPFAPYAEGKSYVIVTFDGATFHYYVVAQDESGYSIPLIDIKDLNERSITTDINTIENNIYSIDEITKKVNNKYNIYDTTNQFAMQYKSKVGNVYKIQIGQSVYNPGNVVQLKDGSKWYVLPAKDESGNVVDDTLANDKLNLVSYNHMDTYSGNYGTQSDSKTMPTIPFDENGSVVYEGSTISAVAKPIIASLQTKLIAKDINLTGTTIGIPKLEDFCGINYDEYVCSRTVNYLGSDGGFWTADVSDNGKYVIGIENQAFSYTNPSYGLIATDKGYGIRVAIRNLSKSNIDKAATNKLN